MTATFTAAPPPATAAPDDQRAHVLLVDDEPALLSSMRRQFSGQYRVSTESDPVAALGRLDDPNEFDDLAVIVSDMRMPGLDGAEFLREVHARRPDITRILLTGFAELESAIAAINQGRIFRFLSKPVTPEAFQTCLDDAVRQHQLVRAERDLLEQTLRGSIKALVDTLAMANPTAFTRASRIGRRLTALAHQIDAPDLWEIEVAGMLSHIGTVVLPPGTNDRLATGQELTPRQQGYVAELPTVANNLLADIPRLDNVRRIIAFQQQRHDGRGPVAPDVGGDDIPLGARLLRVASDYDTLEARGQSVDRALETMRANHGLYDPTVLDALAAVLADDAGREIKYLTLQHLRAGMVLAQDLCTDSGTLLVGRGHEFTTNSVMRVRTWGEHTAINQPIAVYLHPDEPTEEQDQA